LRCWSLRENKFYISERDALVHAVGRGQEASGTCCPRWAAIKEEEIAAMSNRRDLARKGYINYEDYVEVFFRLGSGRKLNPNPVF
jgi:hypothetical protein